MVSKVKLTDVFQTSTISAEDEIHITPLQLWIV